MALVAFALLTRVAAQTPNAIIIIKGPGFVQTSPTVQEIYQPGFGVFVIFSAPVALATTVQLVGTGATISVPRILPDTYLAERYFDSEAALDRALPDGNYNLTVSGGGTASSTPVAIPSGGNIRPTLITNFSALQSWTETPLRIDWQPIAGGTADDFVTFEIERADGTTIYSAPSSALTGVSTGITVNTLNATPGETLYGVLTYAKLTVGVANGNQTLTGVGRAFFLRFPVIRGFPPRPVLALQPQPQSVVAGSTVAFSVGATGTGLSYQWRRNGVPLTNATSSTYIVTNAQTSTAGFYTVDVTNSAGTVTSESVALTIVTASTNPGRIANLSIRSQAGTGAQTLIVGLAISLGSTQTKPLLLRGVGPGLTVFGVPGVLADPRLEVFSGTTKINENDNWNGDVQVIAISSQVGAFALGATTSQDAALFNPSFAPGTYTIQVTGNAGGRGVALAEIYDATPTGSFTTTTPRLVNVSARTQVGLGGDILIAGFVINGNTSKTVLIRAVGPTLAVFGVPGALLDPKLEVFSGNTQIHANDNWGGATQISSIFSSVGAFALSAASRDAAIVATLPPGNYTAQVSGVGNSTGVALVEVYELP